MSTAAQTRAGTRRATRRAARRPWTPSQIILTLIATAVSAVFLAPLAWALFTSLKSETEAVEVPTHWLPKEWTTQAWRAIFETGNMEELVQQIAAKQDAWEEQRATGSLVR